MDNSTPPIAAYLAGPRIALRAPVLADADAIATWDDAPLPHTPEAGRELLRRSEQTPWGNAEHIRLMIDDDSCIGGVTLRHIDLVNRTAETGSGLLAAADRGQGLGTEAKHVLLRFAFETLGLHAISSIVYSGNARSIAALRKQGYRPAGRLTADVHRGGRFTDALMFDLLRHEWEAAAVEGR